MSISPYAILGINDDASLSEAEGVFIKLSDSLSPSNFKQQRAQAQAQRAIEKLGEAYNKIRDPDFRSRFAKERDVDHSVNSRDSRPRLGQICVASGLITMEQLKEAVEEQVNSWLPLGEVLQDKQFISPIQLEGLLLGQEMIDVSSKCDDPDGQRLIALDLISDDMVLIAQMEQKSTGQPLVNLLLRRGWIEKDVLTALGMLSE